ncbi:MAG: hypothetical protein RTU30_02560 [Candidatus Thorarchaeota archaeon]
MQGTTLGFIGPLLLETISGVIAILIAHYANSAFRLTGQKRLSDLSTGFLVLSASMFGRVIGTIYFVVLFGPASALQSARSLIFIVSVTCDALRIMAYILFAISTRRTMTEQTSTPIMLMALPWLIDPNLEMIAIVILLIVVLQSLMNYMANRSRYALYVLSGFLFLLLSHVFLIFEQIDRGYTLSQIFQFLGLIALLFMLWKAGRE